MLILAPDIKAYCDEKIKLFRDKNMWSAPKSEIIGVLSGYELIENKREYCGGYCNLSRKQIALDDRHGDDFKTWAMFHEMIHTFKADLEIYEKEQQLLSEKLKDEVEVEMITRYMTDILYPGRIGIEDVGAYTWSKEDAQFLLDWYGDWVQNDLMI